MRPDYIFADLDGVIAEGEKVSRPAAAFLKFCKKNRLKVCPVTGRSWPHARRILRAGGFSEPYILEDGAVILSGSGKEIDATPLPRRTVTLVADVLKKIRTEYAVFCHESRDYYIWPGPSGIIPFTPPRGSSVFACADPGEFIDAAGALKARKIVISSKETLNSPEYDLPVHASEGDSYAFLAPGMSKGAAIRAYLRRVGIPPKKVWVCGNDWNDISMFRLPVGFRAAIRTRHTPPELLSLADIVFNGRIDARALTDKLRQQLPT